MFVRFLWVCYGKPVKAAYVVMTGGCSGPGGICGG